MDSGVGSRASVELSAGTFSYLEAGDGPPLVFLHALGRSASDWGHVIGHLKDSWRCLALDQRGHGDSVRAEQYRFGLMENDFREFVDALDLEEFALVAHSMGGVVGLLFAEKTPDRLTSFVLEDTTAPMDHHEYPIIPPDPPESVDYDWASRRQLFEELNAPDPAWLASLPQITARTLLIASTQDEADVEKTVRLMPDVQTARVETDHWIHENEPAKFLEIVMGFLQHERIHLSHS